MRVDRLDHLVLTVRDIDETIRFYCGILGMTEQTFGDGRKAVGFGSSKMNLHQAAQEFTPHAEHPTPGSADLCFIVDDDIDQVCATLARHGVSIEEGPVDRTGAIGEMRSVYIRDPDNNLIELSNYVS